MKYLLNSQRHFAAEPNNVQQDGKLGLLGAAPIQNAT